MSDPAQQHIVVKVQSPPPSQHLPALASFFLPGVGQLIQGRLLPFLCFQILWVISLVSLFLVIGFILVPIVGIWSALEASRYIPSSHSRPSGCLKIALLALIVPVVAMLVMLPSAVNKVKTAANKIETAANKIETDNKENADVQPKHKENDTEKYIKASKLQRTFPLPPVIDVFNLNVGEIGVFENKKINYKVMQVLVDRLLIRASDEHKSSIFLLDNVNTDGLVTDSYLAMNKCYKIIGTETYKTFLATNTVFVVKEANIRYNIINNEKKAAIKKANAQQKELLESQEKQRLKLEEIEAKRQAAIEEARWHTWKSADGKFTVEARFTKSMAGIVHLEKRDGTLLKVSMEKLSDEDQKWIKKKSWNKD